MEILVYSGSEKAAYGLGAKTFAVGPYKDPSFGVWVIHDLLADGRNGDSAGQRIFYADHGRGDDSLHLGFLKTEIGVDHFAVHQL